MEMNLLEPFLELLKIKNDGVDFKIKRSNNNDFEQLTLVNLIYIIFYFNFNFYIFIFLIQFIIHSYKK